MQRRAFVALSLVLAATGLLGCAKKSPNGGALKEMTVDEVAAKIAAKDGKTYIFDNNDKERWTKGHVPGAKWVAFNKVTASDLPAEKDATLVFYCAHEL